MANCLSLGEHVLLFNTKKIQFLGCLCLGFTLGGHFFAMILWKDPIFIQHYFLGC